MARTAVTVDVLGLPAGNPAEELSDIDKAELLDGLGRLVQGQSRRRIKETKTAPDGNRWPPNRAGTSTLYRSGRLYRSIDYAVSDDQVAVGSGLVYARPHQLGATIRPKNAKALRFEIGNRLVFSKTVEIPARPYLGISAEDQEEIEATVIDFIASALGGGDGAAP